MESNLVTLLSSLVGGRVYPDIAPAGAATPYCTYQQAGGRSIQYLSGGSGSGIARIQINVWSTTRAEALSLIRQIEQAIPGSPLYGTTEGGAVSIYEKEQRLYGNRQDFSIKY